MASEKESQQGQEKGQQQEQARHAQLHQPVQVLLIALRAKPTITQVIESSIG